MIAARMANEPKHEYDAESYLGSLIPISFSGFFFLYIFFAFLLSAPSSTHEVAID
jgi:hypothetical protein